MNRRTESDLIRDNRDLQDMLDCERSLTARQDRRIESMARQLGTAPRNRWLWLVTFASMVGVSLNALQNKWCFAIWLVTNTVWIVHNWRRRDLPQAAVYLFNLLMAIGGLIWWSR